MELTTHRAGENGLLPFRTQRVFNLGGKWFFALRGEKDCGPFESIQEAQTELNLSLREFKENYYHAELNTSL